MGIEGNKMKSGYQIETHKESGRFIVWRLTEDNKYRQGSYDTYEKAFERMSESMKRMDKLA